MSTTIRVTVEVTTNDGERTLVDTGSVETFGSNPAFYAQQAEREIDLARTDLRNMLAARYGDQR
jgi:hypothetical protein